MTKKTDSLDRWIDRCEKHAVSVLEKHNISTRWPDFVGLARTRGKQPDKDPVRRAASMLVLVRCLRESLSGGNIRDAICQSSWLTEEAYIEKIRIGMKNENAVAKSLQRRPPSRIPEYQEMMDKVFSDEPEMGLTDIRDKAAKKLGITRRTLERNHIKPRIKN
ncbi:MAG: hypothetical protein OES26_20465 [Gammaproteobacteria bacterium]|nr:hypothetical protein [Gammaproteobacteria bacterium]